MFVTMQLTRAADYGVRAMVHLAGLPGRTRASIAELAKAANASEAFLTKVLQRLANAGLIASFRGPTGGIELNSPAVTTSLLDVVEAIEGPIQLNLCTGPLEDAPACGRQSWCAVHLVWARAQAGLREVLRGATLADLARDSAMRVEVLPAISTISL